MKSNILYVLVGAIFMTSCGSFRQPALKVGISADYEPICYKENGELKGLEVDFANLLGEHLNRNVEFVELPFDELINSVNDGRVDIIMSGLTVTKERSRRVSFTNPYMKISQMMLVRSDELGRFRKPGHGYYIRNNMRVATVSGTTGDKLSRRYLKKRRITPFTDLEEATQALKGHHVDVVIYDSPAIWQYADGKKDPELAGVYWELGEEQMAWAVSTMNGILLEKVNHFYNIMVYQDRMRKVMKRWVPMRVSYR